jgi:mRNA-degrading endonuclease toxin of MazEF toxin-antitoxin module
LKPGDIYFVSLDPTFGREQQGYRPVFVITTEAFNRMTRSPIIAAITTGGAFARRKGLTVDLPLVGMKTRGSVRVDQIRTLDLSARNARFVEAAPQGAIDEVLDRIVALFDSPHPAA